MESMPTAQYFRRTYPPIINLYLEKDGSAVNCGDKAYTVLTSEMDASKW
jgi:hypothetical protein